MSKPVFEDILNYREKRRNRKSFILAMLFLTAVSFSYMISAFMIGGLLGDVAMAIVACLGIPVIIAVMIAQIAISAQRFRDFGKSGWLALLLLIPYVAFVAQIVLCIAPGQSGENQYGPDPLFPGKS